MSDQEKCLCPPSAETAETFIPPDEPSPSPDIIERSSPKESFSLTSKPISSRSSTSPPRKSKLTPKAPPPSPASPPPFRPTRKEPTPTPTSMPTTPSPFSPASSPVSSPASSPGTISPLSAPSSPSPPPVLSPPSTPIQAAKPSPVSSSTGRQARAVEKPTVSPIKSETPHVTPPQVVASPVAVRTPVAIILNLVVAIVFVFGQLIQIPSRGLGDWLHRKAEEEHKESYEQISQFFLSLANGVESFREMTVQFTRALGQKIEQSLANSADERPAPAARSKTSRTGRSNSSPSSTD